MILAAICARQDPKVHYRNCTNTDKLEEWYAVFDDPDEEYEKFIVCYRCRCLGTFVERFELQQFPMDTQVLGFQVCCQAESAPAPDESAPEHGGARTSRANGNGTPASRRTTVEPPESPTQLAPQKATTTTRLRSARLLPTPRKTTKSIVNADK